MTNKLFKVKFEAPLKNKEVLITREQVTKINNILKDQSVTGLVLYLEEVV